jgi:hypothetical protein
MTRLTMNARDRRALLAGIAAIAFVLAVTRGVPAWLDWQREARGADAEARDLLARERSLIEHGAAVRESTSARGRRLLALAPAILSGDAPSDAGATLAGVLSGAAALAGVRLGSVQLRGDSLSRGAFTRIGARMDVTGDIRGVMAMLASLERGPTLLAVRSLSISQPDLTAGDDRVEALHVEIDVEGLMFNPKAKRAP